MSHAQIQPADHFHCPRGVGCGSAEADRIAAIGRWRRLTGQYTRCGHKPRIGRWWVTADGPYLDCLPQ